MIGHYRRHADSGMTLVEVLFASTILLVAMMGMMALLVGSQTMSIKAKEKADLVNAVTSYIERARDLPFTSVGALGGYGGSVPGSLTATTSAGGGYAITITTPTVTLVTTDSLITSATSQYKRITVTGSARTGPSDSYPVNFTVESLISTYPVSFEMGN